MEELKLQERALTFSHVIYRYSNSYTLFLKFSPVVWSHRIRNLALNGLIYTICFDDSFVNWLLLRFIIVVQIKIEKFSF